MPAPRYYSAAFPSLLPSPQAIRYPTTMALSMVGGDPENGAARILSPPGPRFLLLRQWLPTPRQTPRNHPAESAGRVREDAF